MTEPTNPSDKPEPTEYPTGTPEYPTGTPSTPESSGTYNPQGYPPPGYPPQGYAPPGYAPQGYTGPGYPPGAAYPPPPPGGYPPPPTGYPPAPPQPYAGYGAPLAAAPKNGLGIAALIAGLLALPAAFTIFGGFVLGAVAIILGIMGYRRAKSGEATNGGMATGGMVLGALGIIASIALLAFGFKMFNEFGGRDLMDCMRDAGNDRVAQQQCQDEFQGNLEDRFSITITPTP